MCAAWELVPAIAPELREHRKERVFRIAARDRVLDLEIGDRMDLRRHAVTRGGSPIAT
jgi:hypothetical protein